MKKTKILALTSIVAVSMTTLVFALWWNSFTWFHRKITPRQEAQQNSAPVAENVQIKVASSTIQSLVVKQEPGSEDVTWKKYVNEKYEFEFKYPSYFGEVVITNNFGECLTMKTYERNGVIDGADIFISFSNKPNVGKGGSHMEYYMTVFSNKKIDSTVCGVKLNDYKNSISQHSSTIFQQNNSVETYKSTIGTSMGTSVDIFYTLFSIKESNVTIIQSTAAFIPLFNSEELIEISKIEAEGDKQAIMTFVNKNIKANGVREKLIDFEEIVESIKFLN